MTDFVNSETLCGPFRHLIGDQERNDDRVLDLLRLGGQRQAGRVQHWYAIDDTLLRWLEPRYRDDYGGAVFKQLCNRVAVPLKADFSPSESNSRPSDT